MSGFGATFLCFAIFVTFVPSDCLVELPPVGDNDILNTEAIIRATTNKLFTTIKLKGVKKNSKLKEYRLIHNYFVSLTLKDYKLLKEIARLTKTDKKPIDKTSINFIDLINEILNEDSGYESKSKTTLSNTFNDEVKSYIDDYSNKIIYLKATYGDNSPRADINKGIVKILTNNDFYLNTTGLKEQKKSGADDDGTLLEESEFWIPDKARRIFGGKNTEVEYFPFMASISVFNNFQCGGAIIQNDLVITAASCLQLAHNNRLFRENPDFLSVTVGSKFFKGGGENIPAVEVYFYPTYNPKNLHNNIAIIRLLRRIKFPRNETGRCKKIDFDRRNEPLSMNAHSVTIVGWGAQRRSDVIRSPWKNKLTFASLDLFMLKECQDIYSAEYVTDLNFCAGFLSKGGGACLRDVGNPGLVSGLLTGVVSFGAPVCGAANAPTVFTKVGYYADWIEEIMDMEVPINRIMSTLRTTFSAHRWEPDHSTPSDRFVVTAKHSDTDVETTVREPTKKVDEKDFKQFLKTMFDSKEIEDYIDLIEPSKDNIDQNADIVGIRQDQLDKNGPYLHHITEAQTDVTAVTPIVHTHIVPSIPVFDEAFKANEPTNKADDLDIFEPDLDIEDNDIISKGDITEIDDDVESGKDLEKNIMKLIDKVDLKDKIAQAAKRDKTILDKDQTLDNTILSLLASDTEGKKQKRFNIDDKDKGVINVEDEEDMNYLIDYNDDETDKNLGEDTDNMYDHEALRFDDDMPEGLDIEDKGDGDKKDFDLKKVGELNDVFSKKVLFELLSDVIDQHTKNNSVKN